jgi:hypothetical protein
MAENIRYTLVKPARLLYSSVTQKSAPKNVPGAVPKFSGTFGLEKEDFDAIVGIMVNGIKSELGSFSGNPGDYYLAAMSGVTAGKRAIAKGRTGRAGQAGRGSLQAAGKSRKACGALCPVRRHSHRIVAIRRRACPPRSRQDHRHSGRRACTGTGGQGFVLSWRLCRAGTVIQGVPSKDARCQGWRDRVPSELPLHPQG